MHHLDCPWRPADIAQRDGRGIRQGNQNREVAILRYATERSFDGYCWQTVERKAKFIAQVMRGRLDVREIEDIGDTALSFAEVKALACGDPLILDRAKAEADLTRLERLQRAHHRAQTHAGHTIGTLTREHTTLTAIIPRYQYAIAARLDTRGEAFQASIHPPGQPARTVRERAAAADLLREGIHAANAGLPRYSGGQSVPGMVDLGGHSFDLHVETTCHGPTPRDPDSAWAARGERRRRCRHPRRRRTRPDQPAGKPPVRAGPGAGHAHRASGRARGRDRQRPTHPPSPLPAPPGPG